MKNTMRPQSNENKNTVYPFTPVITPIAVPLLLFGRRKKTATTGQPPQEKTPKPAPKPKSLVIDKYEIVENVLKFFVTRGFFKKRLVTVKEIPIGEISVVESLGHELKVTWNGFTNSFIIKKKGESFSKLRDQIQSLVAEQQKNLENAAKAKQRKSDLSELIDASIRTVDASFNMLLNLQVKNINWTSLETFAHGLGENKNFAWKTLAPLSLDFSNLHDGIKNQTPDKTSKETFNILKSLYVYFEDLKLEDDLGDVHPNFNDAKSAVFAYYMLNDLWLAKIVGEKDSANEVLELEIALQNLSKETGFRVVFEDLVSSFDKIASDFDIVSVVEDSREIFRVQLKNIDHPVEVLSTVQPPAEQAIEPSQPPAPQEPMAPPESQAPAPPQTLEPAVEQPQVARLPSEEPTPIEQKEPVPSSNPLEPEQPTQTPEVTAPITTEAPASEQEALPLTDQLPDQPQEPAPTEPAQPESEDKKDTSEIPPKKKSALGRLRKSIMGY
jgi:hypothetical protein